MITAWKYTYYEVESFRSFYKELIQLIAVDVDLMEVIASYLKEFYSITKYSDLIVFYAYYRILR